MANQYTLPLTPAEAETLRNKIASHPDFIAVKREWADWCFEGVLHGAPANAAFYPKKKRLLIQGRGADAFLKEVLELEPDAESAPAGPALTAALDESPHFGVDESGKGDYFGPLCVAGVYSSPATARELVRIGCRDSKAIPDDRRIREIAEKIKHVPGISYEVMCIGPKRYNELYAEFGNLNRLLAWAHARVIAVLHEKVPSCPRALSDQFANEWVLKKALGARHIPVKLEQRTKGESDIAVAAASILARDRFVQWMQATAGGTLPLGCAPHVTKAAKQFVAAYGAAKLPEVAKLHFKVTKAVLPTGEA